MYARVTEFDVDPRDIDLDLAQEAFEKLVLPEMRKETGYEGFYLLRTKRGKGLLIALWEDEQAAVSSENTGYYAEQLELWFPLLGKRPPERDLFKVAIADHPEEVE